MSVDKSNHVRGGCVKTRRRNRGEVIENPRRAIDVIGQGDVQGSLTWWRIG